MEISGWAPMVEALTYWTPRKKHSSIIKTIRTIRRASKATTSSQLPMSAPMYWLSATIVLVLTYSIEKQVTLLISLKKLKTTRAHHSPARAEQLYAKIYGSGHTIILAYS